MKKAFRELRVPVCGRFYPNEGGVAGYGNRIRVKYTAKWGLQIAKMIFQTRSRGEKTNQRKETDEKTPDLTWEYPKVCVNLQTDVR